MIGVEGAGTDVIRGAGAGAGAPVGCGVGAGVGGAGVGTPKPVQSVCGAVLGQVFVVELRGAHEYRLGCPSWEILYKHGGQFPMDRSHQMFSPFTFCKQ